MLVLEIIESLILWTYVCACVVSILLHTCVISILLHTAYVVVYFHWAAEKIISIHCLHIPDTCRII